MQFVKILDFEYIGEVITPDKNTDVPSKHKDLYNITVSTDGDITKHKVIIEDRWFDYPPSTNEQFDKVIRKEFGNWVVNDFTAWYMYLDAFKKAHPEVADEMIQDSLTLASTDTGERCVTLKAALDWHAGQCKMCSERSKFLNNVKTMNKKDIEDLKMWLRVRGYSFRDSEIAKLLRKPEDDWDD